MEAYPSEYAEHNLPLLFISGLGEPDNGTPNSLATSQQANGTRITASSSECTGERAESLLRALLQADGSQQAWNASALPGPNGKVYHKMKAVGRTFFLPPRKAAPVAQATSPDMKPGKSGSPSRSNELHSPLSPLSPGSSVHPDGILAPAWFAKHQYQVPALILSVFSIIAAGNVNDTQDERLKSDINSIRASVAKSGYKTKFATVLISDRSILQAPELEDRLLAIRRATNSDSKTGIFFVPPMSAIETSSFVQSMLNTLQPLCIDYYRDLTKHARRKKTRVTPMSTSLANGNDVQPLPLSGWNVRYEIKQGVFAEFRQEMDTAERHYFSAIDELMSSEEPLESERSARWEENRVLQDCLAFRALRCHLWISSTAKAVQFWTTYKARVADLKAWHDNGWKPTEWAVWAAGWAEIMAELVTYADLAAFREGSEQHSGLAEDLTTKVYAMPEKALAARERMPPIEHLHHPGYWRKRAVAGLHGHANAAFDKPSDSMPPRASPSSNGYRDFSLNGEKLTQAAIPDFERRRQPRMVELMRLDLGNALSRRGKHQDAMDILMSLWEDTTWRRDDWRDLLVALLQLLNRCAMELEHSELVLGTTYELLSAQPSEDGKKFLNLTDCLRAMKRATEALPITLKIQDHAKLSPIGLSFAFEAKETYVGEHLGCQLVLISHVCEGRGTLPLSSVTLHFDTSDPITIMHDPNAEAVHAEMFGLELEPVEDGRTLATANLSIAPQKRRIFNFDLIFSDAQPASLTKIILIAQTEDFTIEHSFTHSELVASSSILVQANDALELHPLIATDTTAVSVLPKPPKVRLQALGERKEYYTDEELRLSLKVTNGEGSTVRGTVDGQLSGEDQTGLSLELAAESDRSEARHPAPHSNMTAITKEVTSLEPDDTQTFDLLISAPQNPLKATLELTVDYTIPAEKSTTLRSTLTIDLNFVSPLESKFSFGPLLYTQAWPGYFDTGKSRNDEQPGGIPQLWRLGCQLRSLAAEHLALHKVQVIVDDVQGDSVAQTRSPYTHEQVTFEPRMTSTYSFELYTQKTSLLDARPTAITSTLEITWSRASDQSKSFKTLVSIPRLNLPVSEPRVLCTVSTDASNGDVSIVSYHIENPSTHFLTFALTMEAGEGWAFGGPKHRALSLTPMSRHQVEYRIVLHEQDGEDNVEGMWIWPTLLVVDSFYQKTLRVHPAGDNVKVDDKGNIGVWIEAS